MSENIQLAATARDTIGKANRRLGPSGKLPAVVYGVGHEPVSISLDKHQVDQLLLHGAASSLIELSIDGGKAVHTVIKDVQRDPTKGSILHLDLWAVSMKQHISTVVPIHFVGDAAGVKTGGVLTHNLREVQIDSLPGDMPDSIEVSVEDLEVGDSLHVFDLVAPSGVIITSPADEILCSVTPPTKAVEEEAVEEAAEPEVIGAAETTGEGE
jgi:large subunit ribosomal protein L25